MKRNLLLPNHHHTGALGLALGFACLLCASASAQNLLKNGNFDTAPLGPTNWTVLYLVGGPDSWEMKDRATPSFYHHGSFYDATFRPIDQKLAHACFTQTVTNLTPDYPYLVSGKMREDFWKGVGDPKRGKYLVYIEVIGGQGTPNSEGRTSLIATNNFDPDANIDDVRYPTDIWRDYTVRQTPDANRKIEVRLHYNMVSSEGSVEWDKCWLMAGYFDAISLTP